MALPLVTRLGKSSLDGFFACAFPLLMPKLPNCFLTILSVRIVIVLTTSLVICCGCYLTHITHSKNAYWYYIVVLCSRSLPFVLFNCGPLQPPLRHCKWSPFYAFPFAIIKAVRMVCPSNPLAAVQMASENGLMSHPTHPSFRHSRDFLRSQNKATRPRTSFHRWIALS